MKFVDVILPLALPRLLTYAVPDELQSLSMPGYRVAVQVGKKKIYAAIVKAEHNNTPSYPVKNIIYILDDKPLVHQHQLAMWEWIASYYMCSLGEVMKAALPAALKMESETEVRLSDDWEAFDKLTEAEELLINELQKKETLNLESIADIVQSKNAMPLVQRMLQKQLVVVEEHLQNPFRAKFKTLVTLHPEINSEEALNILLDKLKRAPQQEKLLITYISEVASLDFSLPHKLDRQLLLEKSGVSPAILKACVDKGVFELHKEEVSRIASSGEASNGIPFLSDAQQRAYNEIQAVFDDKQVALLHGVTSSGKTEIYIHLIEQALQQGKQVLYLLPEIALTAQLINRLKKVFGSKVGVYHSKFSDAQRVEVYQALLNNSSNMQVVLGVRSSIFLPFSSLGLVIVDEEHENTYKQQDPAPRYQARDAAIVMAVRYGAKVLLGSATPSIESYYNAITGKYGLVELFERYGNVALPEMRMVNISDLRRKKDAGFLSPLLKKEVGDALGRDEQVILFQNRRGFSPFVECRECGWIPQCEHCNVSLTYHKRTNQLVCHYCGYAMPMPHTCLACGSSELQTKGFGTEKVEEELRYIFPNATVERMDLDTTRSRTAYENIIDDFENRRTQILVGTQMITKGLDFENVSLVGVLNADTMLSFPDFRALERSFQLISQVAGRAGRRLVQGKVLVQTGAPHSEILEQLRNHDYKGMFQAQLEERQAYSYPPIVRLIKISLKHKDENVLNQAAAALARMLKDTFAERVLGPEAPMINRIQNRYIINFLLKIERSKSVERAKQLLQKCFAELSLISAFRQISITPDVDPM
ncbi:MAG: primosomal protein N' [Prevotellaceae bacterium]|jgi:primosomal protein N' (replication factor Y)|nr:primosomal protein N' [Prevotellaceae bacterium]